jgi:Obg family GTPase CgtA-like protein
MSECARRLAELPPVQHYEADYVPPEPVVDTSENLEITHFDDMWVVEGPWLQRLVATVNFSDYESRMYFDRILREAGVFERMEQMGVQNGDTVTLPAPPDASAMPRVLEPSLLALPSVKMAPLSVELTLATTHSVHSNATADLTPLP